MSLRSLSWVLIAFALLIAPIGVQSGAMAMASMPDHQSQAMHGGHCDQQPAKHHGSKASEKSCCAAMCTAVAVAPASEIGSQGFDEPKERPALDHFHHGFLAKLPTPPPRTA